jgi:hypothetical protein
VRQRQTIGGSGAGASVGGNVFAVALAERHQQAILTNSGKIVGNVVGGSSKDTVTNLKSIGGQLSLR